MLEITRETREAMDEHFSAAYEIWLKAVGLENAPNLDPAELHSALINTGGLTDYLSDALGTWISMDDITNPAMGVNGL